MRHSRLTRLVMFGVVNLHDLAADGRLQLSVVVAQVGKDRRGPHSGGRCEKAPSRSATCGIAGDSGRGRQEHKTGVQHISTSLYVEIQCCMVHLSFSLAYMSIRGAQRVEGPHLDNMM